MNETKISKDFKKNFSPVDRRPPLLLLVRPLLLQVQPHLVPGFQRLLYLLGLLGVDLGRDQRLCRVVQNRLHFRERVVDVGGLRPRRRRRDNELAFLVDALLLGSFHGLDQLGLEPVRVRVQVQAEVGLGVDLVDVLPARAARAGKLERDVG